jgi:hypothetical protein
LKFDPEDDWSEDFDGTAVDKADEEAPSKDTGPVTPALVPESSDLAALNESSSSSEATDEEE